MDYKNLIAAIKLCGSTPKVDECKACAYWAGGDMSKCIPRMTMEAAAAITVCWSITNPLEMPQTDSRPWQKRR